MVDYVPAAGFVKAIGYMSVTFCITKDSAYLFNRLSPGLAGIILATEHTG